MREVDSELWLMDMTPTETFNASQPLQSAPSIGKRYDFNLKGIAKSFTYTCSCLRCNDHYAILHCTLAQTNLMRTFYAPRLPTQHANNLPRTKQSQFRGPQYSLTTSAPVSIFKRLLNSLHQRSICHVSQNLRLPKKMVVSSLPRFSIIL